MKSNSIRIFIGSILIVTGCGDPATVLPGEYFAGTWEGQLTEFVDEERVVKDVVFDLETESPIALGLGMTVDGVDLTPDSGVRCVVESLGGPLTCSVAGDDSEVFRVAGGGGMLVYTSEQGGVYLQRVE